MVGHRVPSGIMRRGSLDATSHGSVPRSVRASPKGTPPLVCRKLARNPTATSEQPPHWGRSGGRQQVRVTAWAPGASSRYDLGSAARVVVPAIAALLPGSKARGAFGL